MVCTGHSLLWSKAGNNPSWTWDIFGSEFEEVIYNRIDETMNHFNELGVIHWDVINEMVDQHPGPNNHTFYQDQSGNKNIRAEIYNYVKQNYPNNQFYVNDYGVIMNAQNRFHLFQELLRDLISSGAHIDGIGLQSHIAGNITLTSEKNDEYLTLTSGQQSIDWNLVKRRVEMLWEEFQLPIWITEFDWNHEGDIDWGDHSQHADILEDFYRLMFSLEVNYNVTIFSLGIIFLAS